MDWLYSCNGISRLLYGMDDKKHINNGWSKLARSYRVAKVDDNLSVNINIRWIFHLILATATLVSTFLHLQSRIGSTERRIAEIEHRVIDLEAKHEAEIIQMQEKLRWYEKELNMNPVNWLKKRKK